MENYFNYFTEIEDRYLHRRGGGLLLSTLDWALIETWKDAGIPLDAVLRGIDEAFDRFIGRNGPAYFEGFRLEPAEGIRLIHAVGGFAAWAHPNELDGRDWREFLPAVLDAGIDGLEAFYSKEYPPEVVQQMLDACAEYDLVPTVGSDYHGFGNLANPPGSAASPPDLLERLETRVDRLRRG